MSHVPYRTGIPSIIKLLEQVCKLIVRYKPVMVLILPSEQITYVDAVEQACNDFILNVGNPRPYDE